MFASILANFALHISLDASETERVLSVLQHQEVAKNSSLLQPGNICRNIYFVSKGCLRVFNRDKEGLEHNVLFAPDNWWACDLHSFTHQAPAFYNISALEATEVIFMTHQALEQLYTDVPKFERFFRILTQNGFSLHQYRVNANLSKTATERYALFKKQYPGLEQRIAQKHIASYLGITPVFLSMLRKRSHH